MKENRDFKGVWIPRNVWLDKNLSLQEKCLIIEIDSLDNDPVRGCFASNEYLGSFIGVSAGRIGNIIVELKKKGYLIQCYFDGRNRGLRVHEKVIATRKNDTCYHENVTADSTETLLQTSQKREHNNTVKKTVSNTIDKTTTKRKKNVDDENKVPDFVLNEQNKKRELFQPHQVLNIEQASENLRKSETSYMNIRRLKNISLEEFVKLVDDFLIHIKATMQVPRNESDYRSHFFNWSKIVLNQKEPSKGRMQGNYNAITEAKESILKDFGYEH